MNEIVLYLVCVVPVVCLTLVVGAIGFFAWKVVARVEAQNRDFMKILLTLSGNFVPAAPQIAAHMEQTDATIGKAEAEHANNGGVRRPRQMT